jgi:hypothetical protein
MAETCSIYRRIEIYKNWEDGKLIIIFTSRFKLNAYIKNALQIDCTGLYLYCNLKNKLTMARMFVSWQFWQ